MVDLVVGCDIAGISDYERAEVTRMMRAGCSIDGLWAQNGEQMTYASVVLQLCRALADSTEKRERMV